ncbi:MAG TPA: hypothetical protein PLF22_06050 [Pseudomonadales bacterium]|nr:hypothetical protein [Pseudomonadales bacterium]
MRKSILLMALVLAATAVQAGEDKPASKKRLVDLSDGMNQADFYTSKDADSLWSSDGAHPWKKDDAVNAYEQGETKSSVSDKDMAAVSQKSSDRPAVKPVVTADGKPVAIGTAINIRVRYTLDAEHSKASYSPVSAQNELYRQMSTHCANGFQKLSEWSTPLEAADYYLYYQFRCMEADTK